MINVEAENVRLWVNEHKRDDGSTWQTYSISTSSKDQDGNYINKPLEVRIRRDARISADLHNGALVTIRGSLSNRAYTGKDGGVHKEHMLWAQEIESDVVTMKPTGETGDSFEALEEDMPF